jgi:membrane-associated phospholipid phosphatase
LRKKEEGTYAMPSGDSAAAAIFCFIFAFVVGVPSVYVILPLVMAGRVYYQCHWIGDTIAGVICGTFFGSFTYSHFWLLVPVFKVIAGGENTFTPLA